MYAVRDRHLTLTSADSEASAIEVMRALVATAPGREDDIVIVEVDAHGNTLGQPRDIFDVS